MTFFTKWKLCPNEKKQKTAQNPVMLRPKRVLRSNILNSIKTHNKTFSRSKKPTREPIKLQDDQGVQGVPKTGQATTNHLVFAGIFPAELREGLTVTAGVTRWCRSNAEAGDCSGDHPPNPPAQSGVS